MKKISEVCKLTGVTRRSLQEYDKIGLLPHTSETEGGYWLYDDQAIRKLVIIQIFIEVGYKRKDIKKILENPEQLENAYDLAIQCLQEKRKQIDNLIWHLNVSKITFHLPLETLEALSNIDIDRVFQLKNHKEFLDELIKSSGELKYDDDSEIFWSFIFKLLAVGNLKTKPAEDLEVQACMDVVYQAAIDMEENETDEMESADMTQIELAEDFYHNLSDLLRIDELYESITEWCGEGAVEFILKAARIFSDNLINKEKNKGEV